MAMLLIDLSIWDTTSYIFVIAIEIKKNVRRHIVVPCRHQILRSEWNRFRRIYLGMHSWVMREWLD